MVKRLSDKEKEEISKSFSNGKSIDELSRVFQCTSLTISRNLKKNLGEKKYKDLVEKNKLSRQLNVENENNSYLEKKTEFNTNTYKEKSQEDYFPVATFMEITPLNCEIENSMQKDLSSVPISEFEFPKVVFMVVDKKIELETKYLKDYPDWQFLSRDELDRKTIEIYFDLKIAKSFCSKDQKVIKVPNTNVFKIVAPFLISRGISRIVCPEKLIAL